MLKSAFAGSMVIACLVFYETVKQFSRAGPFYIPTSSVLVIRLVHILANVLCRYSFFLLAILINV